MPAKIEEIRIVHVDCMPPKAKEEVMAKLAEQPIEFKQAFKGYAKMTYVTASPRRIQSVEPITGSFTEYFQSIQREGVEIPSF